MPIANTAGILIAYATAPGKTASDVGSKGGPYARVLAEELLRPGVESVGMFRRVQLKVASAISQEPWLNYGSLPELFLAGKRSLDAVRWDEINNSKKIADFERFLTRFPVSPFSQSARLKLDLLKVRNHNAAARRDWKKLASSYDIEALQNYIRSYPNHAYAVLARNRTAQLREERQRKKARSDWEAVKNTSDISQLTRYAEKYPGSFFAGLAKEKLTQLQQQSAKRRAAQRPSSVAKLPVVEARPAATKSKPSISEAFNLTKSIGSCSAYDYFLSDYPSGFYANLAKAWKKKNCNKELQQLALAKPPVVDLSGDGAAVGQKELAQQLQGQLKRVGCYKGKVDGIWGAGSRRSLKNFSQYANVKFASLTPAKNMIDVISKKQGQVCPVVAARTPADIDKKKTKSKKKPKTRTTKKNCLSYGQCVAKCAERGGSYCSSICSEGYGSSSNNRFGFKVC